MDNRFVRSVVMGLMVISWLAPLAFSQESQPESSATSALKLGTLSEKVPAGTMLPIVFNTAVDSSTTPTGKAFTAFLAEDFSKTSNPNEPKQVILPKGTIVRGRVAEIKKSGLFSRGGAIVLDFDHVVLPSGDLLPLDLNLSANNDQVKRVKSPHETDAQFAYYTDPGISYKLKQGVSSGVNTFNDIKDKGIESGKQIAGGAGVIVTAPLAVVGGAAAGTAISTAKGVMALVGRGESAVIEPGDKVVIDFGGAFTIPTN